MNKANSDHLFDEALEVSVVESAVVILGPDSVAVALTVDAAERSAERLQEAARRARRGVRAPPELPRGGPEGPE